MTQAKNNPFYLIIAKNLSSKNIEISTTSLSKLILIVKPTFAFAKRCEEALNKSTIRIKLGDFCLGLYCY